jgi:putative ABC transport system permease protein
MPEWPGDVSEELRQHLDDQYQELRAGGSSHDDAMRAMRDDVRAARSDASGLGLELIAADARYAFRTLRNHPGFTAVVLVTLALGIGANAAMFSVVNAVVLRPLPYRDAAQLVAIWGNLHRPGVTQIPASVGEFVDYREHSHVFEQIAAYDTLGFNLTGAGDAERVDGAVVASSFFSVLGVAPESGRTFLPNEERPGEDSVIVLSHRFWSRRFGADRQAIGRTIVLDGAPVQIIGVMPASFAFPNETVDLWKPLLLDAEAVSANNRGSHGFRVVARMQRGVTLAQAKADLDGVAAVFKDQYPGNYLRGFSVALTPLHDEVVGRAGQPLLVLLGAVGFVLLIACANVANLLLARGASRRKEIAVRTALGASRGRIVRQLLTESALMAVAGGALGLALARWGVALLIGVAPDSVPRLHEVTIDVRVMLVTAGVSIATGVLFGLVPALRASRADLNDTLKEGGRSGAAVHGRSGRALVVAEISLSLVLLVGAGLLLRSFARLSDVEPGFAASDLLTFRLSLQPARYTTFVKGDAFYDDFFDRVRALPNVRAVTAINFLPFSGQGGSRSVFIEGREVERSGDRLDEQIRIVTDGYFAAMQIPLAAGREFTRHDTLSSMRIAVINESLARKHFPNENPIGKRIAFSTTDPKWYEIVGICRDVKHRGLDSAVRAELYVPFRQPLFDPPYDNWTIQPMYVAIRAADPLAFATTVRGILERIDRDQPISDVRTMEERIGRSLAGRRLNTVLLATFAALALALAAIGIYGIVAYSVTERTREIGVRLALGAQRRDVIAMVLAPGMTLTAIGTVLGVTAALGLTRLMSSLLFGVSAVDPTTFLVIPAVLIAVAFVASYVPARRATKVDPLQSLRSE